MAGIDFTNFSLLDRTEESGKPTFASEASAGENAKIVLAEKDLSDLEHIGSLLETFGFEVLPTQDGWTAFQQVRSHQPSLVIAALDLPKLDGYKLSQRIREDPSTEGIPFMFIMDRGEFPDRLIGHQTYANDYIQKPISIPELKSRVSALLKQERKNGGSAKVRLNSIRETESTSVRDLIMAQASSPEDESLHSLFQEVYALLNQLAECFRRLELNLTRYDKMAGMVGSEAPDMQSPTGNPDTLEGSGKEEELQELENVEDSEPMKEPIEDPGTRQESLDPEQADSLGSADSEALIDKYLSEFRERGRKRQKVEVVDDLDEIFATFLGPRSEGSKQSLDSDTPPVSRGEDRSESGEGIVARGEFEDSEEPSEESKVQPTQQRALGDLSNSASKNTPAVQSPSLPEDVFFDPELLDRFLSEEEVDQAREEIGETQESLYDQAKAYVLHSILGAADERLPNLEKGYGIVHKLIESLEEDRELLLEATDRLQEFSVIGHSVNVAALAIHLARNLGRSFRFQERIGLSALLHEVGVIALPPKLIFKEEKLSSKEMAELRKRPFYSGRVLEKLPEPHNELGEIVSQVYERDNGAGYPRGLKEPRIREEARIIGIVDVFEACIHRRPYKRPLTGYQTLYELSTDPTGTFSDELVKLLIGSVSLFPLNEHLILNNGMTARVVDFDESNLSRPVVEILCDSEGNPVEAGEMVPLADDPSLKVIEVVNPLDNCSK